MSKLHGGGAADMVPGEAPRIFEAGSLGEDITPCLYARAPCSQRHCLRCRILEGVISTP
jgi:hypothetical protein